MGITIDAALQTMLQRFDPKNRYLVYENGLAAMTIDADADTAISRRLRQITQWFIDQQGAAGTWNYGIRQAMQADVPVERQVLRVVGDSRGSRHANWKIGEQS